MHFKIRNFREKVVVKNVDFQFQYGRRAAQTGTKQCKKRVKQGVTECYLCTSRAMCASNTL